MIPKNLLTAMKTYGIAQFASYTNKFYIILERLILPKPVIFPIVCLIPKPGQIVTHKGTQTAARYWKHFIDVMIYAELFDSTEEAILIDSDERKGLLTLLQNLLPVYQDYRFTTELSGAIFYANAKTVYQPTPIRTSENDTRFLGECGFQMEYWEQ